MMFFPGKASIKPQARGICYIIGSDRNPIGSVLCPLVNAVASGNLAVIRPSSVAPKCAEALRRFVEHYLDNRFYYCVTHLDIPVEKIAELPFDFICYTGEEALAKKISFSASSQLVPIHLEIESLCPTVIDGSANIENAAVKYVFLLA